jgi:Asp/Glu/hydantoin racemase
VNVTATSPTARSNSGEKFRARLMDLDWIAGADAAELRTAVHALCWRSSRAIIDGFATDSYVAAKVLITTRGVKDELDIKLAAAGAVAASDDRVALLRRRSAAESVISTCAAAVQFAHLHGGQSSAPDLATDLAAAIAEHRRRVDPADVCEADIELWRVLDDTQSPTTTTQPNTAA